MRSQKKIAAVLLLAACLGGYAAAPVYAAPKAQNHVNRILNKLDRQRDTQLRQQSRNARTARQQQLREQARPGDPNNVTARQADAVRDRAANLQDKQRDQAEDQKDARP